MTEDKTPISQSAAWHKLIDGFVKFLVFCMRIVVGVEMKDKKGDSDADK